MDKENAQCETNLKSGGTAIEITEDGKDMEQKAAAKIAKLAAN